MATKTRNRKGPNLSILDYTSARTAAVYHGKQIARSGWIATWIEYDGSALVFYNDGVLHSWEPSSEDKEATDWGIRG